MILFTVALADPGFSRFTGWLMPEPTSVVPWFVYTFYGNAFLIFAMAAWDRWCGRLMRQFVSGASALLAAMYIASMLYFWPPWKVLTQGWVETWAAVLVTVSVPVFPGSLTSAPGEFPEGLSQLRRAVHHNSATGAEH